MTDKEFNENELLFDELYEKTKDCGRVQFINLLMEKERENEELKKQLDCALCLLSEMYPPCEKDGFMDKHSDYCERNCGVDEEIFKKCWLMYIKDKVSEVE